MSYTPSAKCSITTVNSAFASAASLDFWFLEVPLFVFLKINYTRFCPNGFYFLDKDKNVFRTITINFLQIQHLYVIFFHRHKNFQSEGGAMLLMRLRQDSVLHNKNSKLSEIANCQIRHSKTSLFCCRTFRKPQKAP